METPNETPELLPPAPDQVALALLQGFAASGKFEPGPELLGQVWAIVPHFYLEREKYATTYAPLFFVSVDALTPDEPDFEAQLAAARLGVSSDPDADNPPHFRV